MADVFEQHLPDVRQSLDVCQILQEVDLRESCRSLATNFQNNISNATLQIVRSLHNEWDRAAEVNPTLLRHEIVTRRETLNEQLVDILETFVNKCTEVKSTIIKYLPVISEVRRAYISKLSEYNETLRELTMNETDQTRMTLTRLEQEKDDLRIRHNDLLINYNHDVLVLQLTLDNFKRGIVHKRNLERNEETVVDFNAIIHELRSFHVFPDETTEQNLQRNTEFNSWKEMLRLPSNWLIEPRTPQPEVSRYESFDPANINVPSYAELSNVPSTSSAQETPVPSSSERQFDILSPDAAQMNIPSTSTPQEAVVPSSSEREFNIPSPDFAQINIPSLSRLNESSVTPPSVQQIPQQPISPTFTVSSYASSSLGSDEFRPKSSIGDTPLHRKHIENENLIRHVRRSYWKLQNEVHFYTSSNPFSNQYREIQELNATVQSLSREWRTIRATEFRDDSTIREDRRDRERDLTRDEEEIERPRTQRTSMKSIDQIYSEWIEARDNLKTYAASIIHEGQKITELQKSLENLYLEMERNDDNEQLSAAEDTINNELKLLRRKINEMRPEIKRLRSIVFDKKQLLFLKLQKLQNNLLRRKAKLEEKIARSQNARD